MTRLRAVIAAAAALILGGTGVGVSLYQAGVAAAYDCREWNRDTNQYRNAAEFERAFVAVKSGAADRPG